MTTAGHHPERLWIWAPRSQYGPKMLGGGTPKEAGKEQACVNRSGQLSALGSQGGAE